MTQTPRRGFGEGPLSRVSALVYTVMVVEALFLLTTVPGLALLVLLDRDASNIPLVAACALPVGPAFSAALFALHRRSADLTDLRPAAAFWRGYRMNARGVLQIWVPWLVLTAVLAVNLTHLATAAVPGWWAVPLVVLTVAAALWVVNALVITSLFAFRPSDIARLAGYFLVRKPGVALGNSGVLIAAAGVTAAASEAVLALLASVFALVLLRTSQPMITTTREEFTA